MIEMMKNNQEEKQSAVAIHNLEVKKGVNKFNLPEKFKIQHLLN